MKEDAVTTRPDGRKQKVGFAEFVQAARAVHGDRYDYDEGSYIGLSKKMRVICRTHGAFEQLAGSHLRGNGCIACAGKVKATAETFAEKARAVHGDRYDYSRVNYVNNSTKVEVVCPEHGPFWVKPNNHTILKSGCPACAGSAPVTLEVFIERARKAHGDRYDYSKVVMAGAEKPVTIICPEHGPFEQTPYSHYAGHGCPKCGVEKTAGANRISTRQFVERSRAIHGDKYDYGKVHLTKRLDSVTIGCPVHGDFEQVADYHLNGFGCRKCGGVDPVTLEAFIQRAKEKHGEKYDYRDVVWVGRGASIDVRCPIHGVFRQNARTHMEGHGCPQCAREATSSAGENELAAWVNTLGQPMRRNDRHVLDGMEVDIFLPAQKLAIEYHGAWWHSEGRMPHPRIHEVKAQRAKKAGIRLFTVWDFDWQNRRELVQLAIQHAAGLSTGKRINARACQLEPVETREANAFYERTHIQGPAWRVKTHYGLRAKSGELVACMSFGRSVARRGKASAGEWELVRYASAGVVRGGASRLFAAFVQAHDPQSVWSFSDRQHFGGGLYEALGFALDGTLPADYRVAHQPSGRVWHKSAWQRKHIPARLLELGVADSFDPATDPRTEREMQEAAGVLRIMDAGKDRWLWTKKSPAQGRAKEGGMEPTMTETN